MVHGLIAGKGKLTEAKIVQVVMQPLRERAAESACHRLLIAYVEPTRGAPSVCGVGSGVVDGVTGARDKQLQMLEL